MSVGPWRPANIKDLPGEAAHVINQGIREINGRIDTLASQQRPYIKSSSRLAFGSVPAGSSVEATAHVYGATTTGVAHASPAQGLTLPAGICWNAYVSAQHQVKVRVTNVSGSPVDLSTVLWNVSVTV